MVDETATRRPVRVIQYGMYSAESAGGVETYLINQYRALHPSEMVYDFIARRTDVKMAYEDEIKGAGSCVYHVNSRRYHPLRHYVDLLMLFLSLRGKYDALVVNGGTPEFSYVLLLGWLAGIRCRVYHSHNTGDPVKKGIVKKVLAPIDRILLHFATDYAACSEGAGRCMFGEKSKFTVIPNALDLSPFRYDPQTRNAVRTELGLSGKKVVGAVGNYSDQKNHLFSLRVLKELVKRNNNYELVIVGTANALGSSVVADEMRDYINGNRLSYSVLELGHRNDVPDLMQAFDCFLMPSKYEGFGIVAVEAQASGLPCFLSSCIPQAVNLSKNVRYISLEEAPSVWADAIDKTSSNERSAESAAFDGGIYDIKRTSNAMYNVIAKRLGVIESCAQ